ncbi:MAG: M20 family metallopeptidase [Firmicutes bacterium]|nr:M20 family metallopeptidase [Bacillota bacterium]
MADKTEIERSLSKVILEKARNIREELIETRRKIHKNPEVGLREFQTAKLIKGKLESLGIKVILSPSTTAVVGILEGKMPGKTVALRADMDALTVQEKSDTEYKSQVPDVMHACGHDGHVAMLLGAAEILNSLKENLKGNVKFLFQPAEEGPGGALPMIGEGALKNPEVDACIGLHLYNDLKTGSVVVESGTISAAADEFRLAILGKGGHGASPHEGVDAIVAASHVIHGLQSIVSRFVDPVKPVVITVGTIKGGYRHNIIADSVEMTGTVRTLDAELRKKMKAMMEKTISGITSAFGASYKFEYDYGYPSTVNDEGLCSLVREALADLLGRENVKDYEEATMGAEDFAYFSRKVPSVMFSLGGMKEDSENYPHHHPKFDFNEEALVIGSASLARTAIEFLSR